MATRDAVVAAVRFGLGARPGDLEAIEAQGPRRWLDAQLEPRALAEPLADLPGARQGVLELMEGRGAGEEERREVRRQIRDRFAAEAAVHLEVAAGTEAPLHERLVAFWANHFTVSIRRGQVTSVAWSFEREVVRRHLGGTFEQMLLASTRHPAMLAYLDNLGSIGPDSRAGQRRGRGLNENLAREILELHTLGVQGGYGQADVEALAQLLTGWSLDPDTGEATFYPHRHQPGPKVLLGTTHEGEGERDGVAALAALAHHPSTARHLATKLARHFVADEPPPAAVEEIEAAFLDSGGHLPAVHRAILGLEAAWSPALTKLKTPWELVVSTTRALAQRREGTGRWMLSSLRAMGQLPYQAPSPQGWADVAAEWLGPEAMLGRLDFVARAAAVAPLVEAGARAESVLGPILGTATRRALASEGGTDAVAILLASPEFQRR